MASLDNQKQQRAARPARRSRFVTVLRRTLTRAWRCTACSHVIGIGTEVAVHVEAGAPPNRIYHLSCEPRIGGRPTRG